MKRILSFLMGAACFASAAAQAQRAAATGAHVRLIVLDTINTATNELRYTYPDGFIIGSDGGRLLIRSDSAASDTLRVSVNNISFAEEYMGRRRYTVAGAIAGAAVGAIGGWLLSPSGTAYRQCSYSNSREYNCHSWVIGDKRASGAGALGGAGLLLGAGIGFVVHTDNWKRINPGLLRAP